MKIIFLKKSEKKQPFFYYFPMGLQECQAKIFTIFCTFCNIINQDSI
ncbi:hypothetical protein HMPREF1548_05451 [Clostridium sp. KLE 1755]|nr:hypothetical protein HMPREF1548_05451 [Clostridium sp. KLE 1755]